jgi:hypothetical protein
MAFVVARPGGRFEIRESRATEQGPRARTLATFRELTGAVLDVAEARATTSFDRAAVHDRAVALGAPTARPEANELARRLLIAIRLGGRVAPALAGALRDELPQLEAPALNDNARGALGWIASSAAERGRTLRELVDLGSHLPQRRRPDASSFPPIHTRRPRP